MKINEYTKEIEKMTEEEASEKFGTELVDELLSISAEYSGEDQWYLFYTARIAIPGNNAHLEIAYTVDRDETWMETDELDDDGEAVLEQKLEEDYDWSNYSFSVPDWDDDEEKVWAEQHAK
jgi:hypothetical protein